MNPNNPERKPYALVRDRFSITVGDEERPKTTDDSIPTEEEVEFFKGLLKEVETGELELVYKV